MERGQRCDLIFLLNLSKAAKSVCIMKILTWNINGIRASKIPLKELFNDLDADVICIQETKVTSMFYGFRITTCKHNLLNLDNINSLVSVTVISVPSAAGGWGKRQGGNPLFPTAL